MQQLQRANENSKKKKRNAKEKEKLRLGFVGKSLELALITSLGALLIRSRRVDCAWAACDSLRYPNYCLLVVLRAATQQTLSRVGSTPSW